MSGRTISAYTDEDTAQRIAKIAKLEDRSTGQIAAAALRLYTHLPIEARQALRQLEAMESQEVLERLQHSMTRLFLSAAYENAHQRLVQQMPSPIHDDEDSLLVEATRLTASRS